MFEVGDIVRVITEPPAERHGNHWIFISAMENTCGKEATITRVNDKYNDGCRGYKLDIGISGCFYEEEWLIPVRVLEPVTKEQFDEDFGELIAGVL